MVPVIAVARIILDAVELIVEGAEFLADALDEGTYVDPITLLSPTGDEALAAHQIVDFPIGEVALRRLGQGLENRELGQGQLTRLLSQKARPMRGRSSSLP